MTYRADYVTIYISDPNSIVDIIVYGLCSSENPSGEDFEQ